MEGGEVLMGKGNSADGCRELTGGFTASANTEARSSLYSKETGFNTKKRKSLTEDAKYLGF